MGHTFLIYPGVLPLPNHEKKSSLSSEKPLSSI